jgi:hypothetical protein
MTTTAEATEPTTSPFTVTQKDYATVVETDTYTATLVWTVDTAYTRVYVSGQPEPDMERPSYGVKGENEENDAAWRRYNREELRLMRKALEQPMADLALLLERPPTALKFSRKAGCTCNCSPGFIGDTQARFAGRRLSQISVTVKQ